MQHTALTILYRPHNLQDKLFFTCVTAEFKPCLFVTERNRPALAERANTPICNCDQLQETTHSEASVSYLIQFSAYTQESQTPKSQLQMSLINNFLAQAKSSHIILQPLLPKSITQSWLQWIV